MEEFFEEETDERETAEFYEDERPFKVRDYKHKLEKKDICYMRLEDGRVIPVDPELFSDRRANRNPDVDWYLKGLSPRQRHYLELLSYNIYRRYPQSRTQLMKKAGISIATAKKVEEHPAFKDALSRAIEPYTRAQQLKALLEAKSVEETYKIDEDGNEVLVKKVVKNDNVASLRAHEMISKLLGEYEEDKSKIEKNRLESLQKALKIAASSDAKKLAETENPQEMLERVVKQAHATTD